MAFVHGEMTRKRMLRSWEGRPGPGPKRAPGGWIADLAALGKAVVLCQLCVNRWEPKKYGYQRRRLVPYTPFVFRACDGCGRLNQCVLHLPRDSIHGNQRTS